MKQYIVTALDAMRKPIGSRVVIDVDSRGAYNQGKYYWPDAVYWEVGLKF